MRNLRLVALRSLAALLSFVAILSGAPPHWASAQTKAQSDWFDDFVTSLDPESRPAGLVRELGTNAPRSQIIEVVAGYFRSKDPVQPLWVMPIPARPEPDSDSNADSYSDLDSDLGQDFGFDYDFADKAVDHLITTRAGQEQYGDLLPWFSPDKKLSTLSRFPHFDYLAPAYFRSGDERYARAMVRDMLDFVDRVPISDADQYHVQIPPTINPWNWVLLQWRDKRWIDALAYLRDSPSLSDDGYLRIVHHIWQEIDWLVPHKVLGLHNGTLGNLSTILYAARHFPEARSASMWLSDTGSLFDAFLDLAFYPGEFLVELTLGYSEGTLLMCLRMFEAFPDGPIKNAMAVKLERIVDAHVGMMKPDRSLPRYGDHGAYDISDRIIRRASRLFGRDDLRRLADEPSNANPMEDRLSFPYETDPYYLSGYYAMRDGWDVDAQYLSMDAGPFGTNHHHGDKLSITVSADGAEFIVDPGTSLYTSIEPGPRIDLRPGYLHNVITIDGVDPNSGWDRHYGFDVLENRWITNGRYDYLEGTYEFRNNLIDAIWRRSVLYIKGEYWIVVDALLGTGTHRVESNFQFAIDTEVDTDGTSAIVTAANGSTMQVATAPDDGLNGTVVIGDTTFPGTTFLLQYPTFVDWTPGGRGWVGTFGNESKRNPTTTYPAPALVFTGEVDFPHYSVRVLVPSRNKIPKPTTVEWLIREDDHLRVLIESGGVSDTLDIEVAVRVDGRTKLADDRVRWSRSDGTDPIEINPNE